MQLVWRTTRQEMSLWDRAGDFHFPVCDQDGCGAVFELTPGAGGSWAETTIHTFSGVDGGISGAAVVFDSSGSLYGTTTEGGDLQGGGDGWGTVSKLTPEIGGEWREERFNFPASCTLGCSPDAPVTLDSANNIYGTTTDSSAFGGVIFRIQQ